MKKQLTLIALALVLSLVSFQTVSAQIKVPAAVTEQFNIDHERSTTISWEQGSNWYKASFEINGQYLTTFYTADGQEIAVTRNISSSMLPLALQNDMQSYLKNGHWISDLFEMNVNGETHYFITFEDADEQHILEGVNDNWSVYKRIRKG